MAIELEALVGYLRRKLDSLGPPLLRTVRGVGYKFLP
jgi:DNA-binding response OmpR family regulator